MSFPIQIFNTRTGKKFFPFTLRNGSCEGFEFGPKSTNSVFPTFSEILLAFSQLVKDLRSALTTEQKDLTVFEKCRRWVYIIRKMTNFRRIDGYEDHLHTIRTTEAQEQNLQIWRSTITPQAILRNPN